MISLSLDLNTLCLWLGCLDRGFGGLAFFRVWVLGVCLLALVMHSTSSAAAMLPFHRDFDHDTRAQCRGHGASRLVLWLFCFARLEGGRSVGAVVILDLKLFGLRAAI